MNEALDWHMARALLEWQVELGASEAICDAPIDRFSLPETEVKPPERPGAPSIAQSGVSAGAEASAPVAGPPLSAADSGPVAADPLADAVAEAERLAHDSPDLQTLSAALAGFPHCELRKGARHCVFADGNPQARVMIIGEAPGREEDMRGLPFVGAAGQLLDAMFAEIGLRRDSPDPATALYITNPVPWRPPANRDPSAAELAMLRPFLSRHIELAAPDFVVLMGNIACQTVLERRGIMRLRGQWQDVGGRPVLPTLHPAGLLRTPENRRLVWADLLSLKARLRELP